MLSASSITRTDHVCTTISLFHFQEIKRVKIATLTCIGVCSFRRSIYFVWWTPWHWYSRCIDTTISNAFVAYIRRVADIAQTHRLITVHWQLGVIVIGCIWHAFPASTLIAFAVRFVQCRMWTRAWSSLRDRTVTGQSMIASHWCRRVSCDSGAIRQFNSVANRTERNVTGLWDRSEMQAKGNGFEKIRRNVCNSIRDRSLRRMLVADDRCTHKFQNNNSPLILCCLTCTLPHAHKCANATENNRQCLSVSRQTTEIRKRIGIRSACIEIEFQAPIPFYGGSSDMRKISRSFENHFPYTSQLFGSTCALCISKVAIHVQFSTWSIVHRDPFYSGNFLPLRLSKITESLNHVAQIVHLGVRLDDVHP